MNFTTANQKENRISRTTTQTCSHSIYSNLSVTISGHNNLFSVWTNTGLRTFRNAEGLTLNQAIIEGNKLIK
jgi:hypothetical protein